MKNVLEKDVEAYLVRQVRARGWVTWKLAPTEVGIPDRIVLVPGGSVWFVELKRAKGGRLSERQKYVLRVLERGGHAGCVLAGVEEVKAWLEERDKERAWDMEEERGNEDGTEQEQEKRRLLPPTVRRVRRYRRA